MAVSHPAYKDAIRRHTPGPFLRKPVGIGLPSRRRNAPSFPSPYLSSHLRQRLHGSGQVQIYDVHPPIANYLKRNLSPSSKETRNEDGRRKTRPPSSNQGAGEEGAKEAERNLPLAEAVMGAFAIAVREKRLFSSGWRGRRE